MKFKVRSYQTVVVVSQVEADDVAGAIAAFTEGEIQTEEVESYVKGTTDLFEVEDEKGQAITVDH